MSDHYGWLKGKVPEGGFTATYLADQNYGELEPEFVLNNWEDLDDEWIFTDYENIVHKVTFKRDRVFPILTNGWSELKDVFGWTDQHFFSLLYHGNSTFGIVINDEIKNANRIPPWHSRSTRRNRTARFAMHLSNDTIERPYVSVFDELEDFIRESDFSNLHACCPNGTYESFVIARTDVPFQTTALGVGWEEFCRLNNFEHDDTIVFKFGPRGAYNVVHVRKLAV